MEEKSLETQCKGCKGWFHGLSTAGAEPYPQGLCPPPWGQAFPPQSVYGYLWNTRTWRDHQKSDSGPAPKKPVI